MRKLVEALPAFDLGRDAKLQPIELSCHILARAVRSQFKNLKVKDGFFNRFCEHSWLVTPSGNIIDVYPVAIYGGPILLDCSAASPVKRLYEPKPSHYGKRFRTYEFTRSVETASREVTKVMAMLVI